MFERHGAKSILIARLIFPPFAVNLLAGTTQIRWRVFAVFDVTGSAAFTVSYILFGYFLGKRWKELEAWVGASMLYFILAGIALIGLAVIFRHLLARFVVRIVPKMRKRS
jgi:membrane protein DedA with SNARE-associated domain